jgi:hypothetical protein
MSIKGSPQKWFAAALARGDAAGAWAAAHELGQLSLADALSLCLLLRVHNAALFERAAARWVARFALEPPAMTLSELQLAASALGALQGPELDAAVDALMQLCERHGQPAAAELLERWAREQPR